MANLNQKIVKVTEKSSISIVEIEGKFQMAHLVDGKYSEILFNDVEQASSQLTDDVQDMASTILAWELEEKGFEVRPECDAQVVAEMFSYNVWVACNWYNDNKITFTCSTWRDEDEQDRNVVERKTFKGLVNYLNRFDK